MKRIRHSGEPANETLFSGQDADTDVTKEVQGKIPQKLVNVQIDWTGLTGVLDGDFKLQQSDHELPTSNQWDDMGLSHVLNVAEDSQTLEDVNFSGLRMRAVYTKNGVTGGTFNAEVIAK